MNKVELTIIHTVLADMLVRSEKGFIWNKSSGICGNFRRGLFELYPVESHPRHWLDYLSEIWKNWEKFSGTLEYPIPGAMIVYHDGIIQKWEGTQLELRQSLLRFLIQEVEKDMENSHA